MVTVSATAFRSAFLSSSLIQDLTMTDVDSARFVENLRTLGEDIELVRDGRARATLVQQERDYSLAVSYGSVPRRVLGVRKSVLVTEA